MSLIIIIIVHFGTEISVLNNNYYRRFLYMEVSLYTLSNSYLEQQHDTINYR